jgi:hypothetical protein
MQKTMKFIQQSAALAVSLALASTAFAGIGELPTLRKGRAVRVPARALDCG